MTADNPESGRTTYDYELNGNLKTRATPVATTTYGYDDLHRLKTKTYTGGTPAVTQTWDTCGKGFLCKVENAVSATSYERNAMGWPTKSEQATAGTGDPFKFVYEHNDAGGLKSMKYPSGRVVEYGRDGRNRESSVTSGTAVYANAIKYAAHGGISSFQLESASRTEQWCYNNRMQPVAIRLGAAEAVSCAAQAGDLLNLSYGYGTMLRVG